MLTILKEQALKALNTLNKVCLKIIAQPVETAMVLCNKIDIEFHRSRIEGSNS